MPKVKTFDFPTFEEWKNTYRYQFYQEIGDYCIKTSGDGLGYRICVSTKDLNPTNVYARRVLEEHLPIVDGKDKSYLKDWYQSSIENINRGFEKLILSYLE